MDVVRPAAMRSEDTCHTELLTCDVLVCSIAWSCLFSCNLENISSGSAGRFFCGKST